MTVPPRVPLLRTARLVLRGWREADLAPFAALNADPEVMRYLGKAMTRVESDRMVGRFLEKWSEEPRFGWWALEVPGEGFAGFLGLNRPDFDLPPCPCVEVGWRLARPFWGRGLATEAARACLDHGFGRVGLSEIVSFTARDNRRSQAVMERLGMRCDPAGAFEHPMVAEGDPLRPHVLYRLGRREWPVA